MHKVLKYVFKCIKYVSQNVLKKVLIWNTIKIPFLSKLLSKLTMLQLGEE